ncbi:MAG: enoyl-CoA hydratase [Deltaproteobacteria bacterium]|nr:enoyl-CoA hydratase [Deltaproteobacteria bacterium]
MSTDTQVLVEKAGGVCTITLNRPEKRNAFTVPMYQRCVDVLRDAGADPAVRAVLLTGAGSAFTSGNDVADFPNMPTNPTENPAFQMLLALLDFEKPVVAAVNGSAVGVGVTLLLHCDLVYVADNAKLLMPFVSLALVPEGASSLLVPRMAGFAKANELLLLAEPFDAATAVDVGIATRALPASEVVAFARSRAQRLVELPAASLRAAKRLLRDPLRERVRSALFEEAVRFGERIGSPEAAEAFSAFFEKRKPDFTRFA